MEKMLTTKEFKELCAHLGTCGTYKDIFVKVNGKHEKAKSFKMDCNHTLRHTVDWMRKKEIVEIRANIEKIYDLGGHCDCEVLLNVLDRWKEERNEPVDSPDYMDWSDNPEKEWKEMIDSALEQASTR